MKTSGFLWSIGVCAVLFVVYIAMVFPAHAPLFGGVHTHYRFVLYLLMLFQFGAILLMVAVSLARAAVRQATNASTNKNPRLD